MNLRQLEVFHAIMTYGSVSEAARALNVAQPSVSTVLKHAEQNLGVKLFERLGGRLAPTPEAEQLFPEVDRVYSQMALLSRFTKDLRAGGSGYLAVIGNPTLANTLLPLAVARFREQYPQVRIRLQTSISAGQMADRVTRREFDLGFVYGPNLDVHTGTEVIGHSHVACAMLPDHPLAGLEAIRPADLEACDIITFGVGSPIRNLAEAMFRAAGCELNPVVEASFSATACVLARNGVGVAIIDPLILRTDDFGELVVRPFAPASTIELQIISPKNRPRSMLSEVFIEILKEVTADSTAAFPRPDQTSSR